MILCTELLPSPLLPSPPLPSQNVFGGTEVFTGDQAVHEDYLTAWLEFLSLHPRSPQLMEREHMVVAGLEKVGGASG